MRMFKCKLEAVVPLGDSFRLSVIMFEDHDKLGGRTGELTTTSTVKLIDFERKYAVTKNNIYKWD